MNKNTNANHYSQIYIITKLLNIEYLAKYTDDINIKIDHKKLIKRFEFVLKKDVCTVCPLCKSNNIVIYTNRSHSYKHGNDNMYSNIIKIKYKKYKCNDCEHHFPQVNPIHHYKSMTHELVFSIIDTFQNSIGITVEDVAKQYSLDPKVIRDIIDECLTKIRKPLPEVLGIDEVYFGKGKYLCVLVNFITGDLVDVLDSRTSITLNSYFNRIPLKEREKVLFVTLDMTGYYRDYLHKWLPNTNFAVDLFHLKKTI